MRIGEFAVKNWQFSLVASAMLIGLGVQAFLNIPRAEDPNFPVPAFLVTAVLPGAEPKDIEKLVSKPIEDALDALDDVREVSSTSTDGVAAVRVEFSWDTDPNKKYDEVVREVNAVRGSLPSGVQNLKIEKFDTRLVNVVQIALVSDKAPFRELEDRAKDLRDRLQRVGGVNGAEYWGVPKTEIRVEVDLGRLAALGLSLSRLNEVLAAENASIPAGAIHAGERRFNIKTTGSFDSPEQIAQTVLSAAQGRVVRVADVADVRWDHDEALHITKYNGRRAVFVTANLKEAQNVFKVRDAMYAEVDRFEETLPQDIALERGFDQTRNVAARLGRLGIDFVFALALVLVTLLPLGFRAAFVVMISIPSSIAIGMALLDVSGFTLNQLSITGFVLALGLLVDDSIVVTENIARHLREGMSRIDAAIAATSQIGVAVIGCTASLILAFLPLLALPEGAGKFTRSLPVTVLFTVSASLLVALTLIPFLASRILKEHEDPHGNRFLQVVMAGIHRFYRPLLHLSLARPRTTLAAAMGFSFLTFAIVPKLGFSLFPPADSRQFLVQITTPDGTSLADTKRILEYVDERIRARPDVEWTMSNSGRGNPRIYYNVRSSDPRPTAAEVFVQLKKFEGKKTAALQDELRAEFAAIPGAQIIVKVFENGPPIDAPISLRLKGPDLAELKRLAAEMARIVEETPGTRDVVNPMRLDRTDYNLGIDTAKAGLLGVAPGEADRTMRTVLSGTKIGDFRDARGESFDIIVRPPLNIRQDLDVLNKVMVATASGQSIPLSAIATPRFESGPARIERYKRQRSVTVTAYAATGFVVSKVTADVLTRIKALPLPPGYEISAGGQAEASSRSFAGLANAFLIALFGIMAVLVLEFRSFRTTLVVAGVIPLGIAGGIMALLVTGNSLSFTAAIGFVALVGIEIKNSILLVDFTNQLREQGVGLEDAVEQAGEIRFLPVVLTSATAIGGLLQLALSSSGLYSPLAWVLIGGLISSTFLARLVTPVMYLLIAPKDDEYFAARDRGALPGVQPG